MTQKELLYLEDAIGHEKSIISIIQANIDSIEDENLISFMENEIKVHNTIQEKLMNLLEGEANE